MAKQANLASSIKDTLTHADQWMTGILGTLQWTKEYILQSNEKIPCLNDPNHQIPETAYDKHNKFCRLKKLGYSKMELREEQEKSSKFFYANSETVISLDLGENTIRNILARVNGPEMNNENDVLPLTMSHMNELSREQRLLIYQYCIDTAVAAKKPTTVPIEDLQFKEDDKSKGDGRTKSVMELKAEERDLKRRRQSYRSKNVHSGKKSYKDVIREVIEMQTTLLQEKLVAEKATKSPDRQVGSGANDDKEGKKTQHQSSKKRVRSTSPDGSEQNKDKDGKKSRHRSSKKCSPISYEDSGQYSDHNAKVSNNIKLEKCSRSGSSEDDHQNNGMGKTRRHKKHKKHKRHKSNKE